MSWPFICKTRAQCHCLLHTTLKILAYNFLTRGNRKFDTFSFGSEKQHGTKKGELTRKISLEFREELGLSVILYLLSHSANYKHLVVMSSSWNFLARAELWRFRAEPSWGASIFELQFKRICKIFEITRTIYSNTERSEQFWVTECFFNLFLEAYLYLMN